MDLAGWKGSVTLHSFSLDWKGFTVVAWNLYTTVIAYHLVMTRSYLSITSHV